jgi:Ran GTPase-activating protein (RanGAP) involved in mRNA processing and transport
MLEKLPVIFWQNCICLLSEQELRKLLCKLSETSKYLYDISKSIKLNSKCEFLRNIYIPLNSPFTIIDATITRFIKQYEIESSLRKWTVHIDIYKDTEYNKIEQIIKILSLFNIGVSFNGCYYYNHILIHNLLNIIEPTQIVKLERNEKTNFIKYNLSFIQDSKEIEYIEKLPQVLEKMINLETFKLQYNNLNTDLIELIVLSLCKLNKLTNLNIGGDYITASCITLVAPVLTLAQLTSLEISNTFIGFDGALLLAPILESMTQLKTLKLSKNKFGSNGMSILAPSFAVLKQLNSLDIGWNNIGPRGTESLVLPLSNLTQLVSLNISGNSLGKLGAITLAPVIAKLTQLTTFICNVNYIPDDGWCYLGPSLERLSQLTTLNLSHNTIIDKRLFLANIISRMHNLTNINLSANHIIDASLQIIVNAITSQQQNATINITDNSTSRETRAQLMKYKMLSLQNK